MSALAEPLLERARETADTQTGSGHGAAGKVDTQVIMNPSTLLGMLLGLALAATVILSDSASLQLFWNGHGLAIVLGGTLAATLISYPLNEVLRVFRVFWVVLRNERLYEREDLDELVEVSRIWFSGNMAAADDALAQIRNPFLKTGLQLVIDGSPLEDILDLLQWRISRLKAKEQAEAQVFRSMANYAPAFGMVGTLIGLINLMSTMESRDFAVIGAGMAVALITTFYGILLANLVFKPIATKLERRTERRLMLMQMVMEGVTLISQHRSPAYIRATLESFRADYQDEINQGRQPAPADKAS